LKRISVSSNQYLQKKDQQEQNQQMQQVNASLKAENWSLRKAILTQTCVTCCGKTLPFNPLLEKQHLLTKNAELKDKFLRVSAIQSKIIRDSAFTQPVPWISSRSSEVDREALLHYTKASMEQFLVLATKGEPSFQKTMGELMWLPAADGGEVLNFVEYRAKFSQALFGLRPEGFAVEATRDAAIVWGSAAELVSIFMDTVPICSISSATHSIWAFHVSVLDSLCVCLCCFAGSLVRDVPWGCGKCGSR